eukprot:202907-Chlamydomonas_euryale.AAC.2
MPDQPGPSPIQPACPPRPACPVRSPPCLGPHPRPAWSPFGPAWSPAQSSWPGMCACTPAPSQHACAQATGAPSPSFFASHPTRLHASPLPTRLHVRLLPTPPCLSTHPHPAAFPNLALCARLHLAPTSPSSPGCTLPPPRPLRPAAPCPHLALCARLHLASTSPPAPGCTLPHCNHRARSTASSRTPSRVAPTTLGRV